MNGIDNLALYKTVDELQESKNSIERRTGIDFSKNVQQFDLLLDIIGEETPETEEKRQVEVVEQILEAVWPKNLFEAYCSDKDNIVQAVYSNMIASVDKFKFARARVADCTFTNCASVNSKLINTEPYDSLFGKKHNYMAVSSRNNSGLNDIGDPSSFVASSNVKLKETDANGNKIGSSLSVN